MRNGGSGGYNCGSGCSDGEKGDVSGGGGDIPLRTEIINADNQL